MGRALSWSMERKPIPSTINETHRKLLEELDFEAVGHLSDVISTDKWDGWRLIYAITNPEKTEVVYVGDTEQGRDVRQRLKAHIKDREKAGHVENDSLVLIHVMVTEYWVLTRFEEESGKIPKLNKRKAAKHV